MNSLSLYLPIQPTDPAPLRLFAREAHDIAAGRLWVGQSMTVETQDVFAYLSGLGYAMSFGSGVELMPLRHPFHAAASARSTALLSGHRHVMGLGTGALSFRRLMGVDPRSPLGFTRDYVRAVRALLDGAPWSFGEAAGAASLPPLGRTAPEVEVGVGVLGAKMAGVVGEVADRAITWLAPLEYLADVVMPAIADGAESRSSVPKTTAVVHCAVSRADENPVETVLGIVGRHLATPHYVRMLRHAGLTVDIADPAGNARAVWDSGTFLHGEPEVIAAGIAAHWAAGVDEVVVNVGGVSARHGAAAAVEDLRAIFAAVDELRTSRADVPGPSDGAAVVT